VILNSNPFKAACVVKIKNKNIKKGEQVMKDNKLKWDGIQVD
jgi:hypothetical protein